MSSTTSRAHLIGNVHDDLVVEPRWRAQARRAVVRPIDSRLRLIGCTLGPRSDAIPTETLDFVEGDRVLRAIQGGRRRDAELRGRLQDERLDLAPVRTHGERHLADRILPPLPRLVARDELDAEARLGMRRPVASGQLHHRPGGLAADLEALHAPVCRQDSQLVAHVAAHDVSLRREHLDERVVGGLRDGGVDGSISSARDRAR